MGRRKVFGFIPSIEKKNMRTGVQICPDEVEQSHVKNVYMGPEPGGP